MNYEVGPPKKNGSQADRTDGIPGTKGVSSSEEKTDGKGAQRRTRRRVTFAQPLEQHHTWEVEEPSLEDHFEEQEEDEWYHQMQQQQRRQRKRQEEHFSLADKVLLVLAAIFVWGGFYFVLSKARCMDCQNEEGEL